MVYRHIRADNQKNIGMLNIVVTGRRSIGTERTAYTPTTAEDIQSRLFRVYVIRPEEAFEQFIENVGRLCV